MTETKTFDSKKKEDKKDENTEPVMKVWNESEVKLLKKWGETAASYRLLHDRAYRANSKTAYRYTIPIIVLSTITGTASFSQTLFPVNYQPFVPMVIGGINIFVGILSTISRFFRIDELTEAHRVASISYGKFARNIATELSLPPMNRKYNGSDLVEMCRTEMDRLIEQSPIIDMDILRDFQKNPDFKHIQKPEVLVINPIEEYKLTKEEKVAEIVSHVVERLKQAKPEKTLVQQMVERHGGAGAPTASPYIHATLPSHLKPPAPPSTSELMNEIRSKGAEEAQLQVELVNVAGKRLVSHARAKFMGMAHKAVRSVNEKVEKAEKTNLPGSKGRVDDHADEILSRLESLAKDEEKKKRIEDLSDKVEEAVQEENISDILQRDGDIDVDPE